MRGKTHEVGGICAGLILSQALIKPPYNNQAYVLMGAMTAGALVGAIFNDIDTPDSIMGHQFPRIATAINHKFGHRNLFHNLIINTILCMALYLISQFSESIVIQVAFTIFTTEFFVAILSYIRNRLNGKSGIIKNPIIYLIIFVSLFVAEINNVINTNALFNAIIIGFYVGTLSHIFLDSLTVKGTPLFYPISSKRYRLMKLRTGHNERIVSIFLVILTVFLCCNHI